MDPGPTGRRAGRRLGGLAAAIAAATELTAAQRRALTEMYQGFVAANTVPGRSRASRPATRRRPAGRRAEPPPESPSTPGGTAPRHRLR